MMRTSRKTHVINEEYVCIDSLVHRLKGVYRERAITVRKELHDPPDFWLDIGGDEYAAEVTSIATDQEYDGVCRRFAQAITGELQGIDKRPANCALIVLRRPEIPRRGAKSWKELVCTAVDAARGMDQSSAGEETILMKSKAGRLSLKKLSVGSNIVGWVRVPEAKWEGETRRELSQLIQRAIDTKRGKLEKKGILNSCPVLLLLYDAFGYGDVEDARKSMESLEDYEWLHSIFWAASFSDRENSLFPDSPGRSGVFLYSRNEAWR